jgi:hypothetical protein
MGDAARFRCHISNIRGINWPSKVFTLKFDLDHHDFPSIPPPTKKASTSPEFDGTLELLYSTQAASRLGLKFFTIEVMEKTMLGGWQAYGNVKV